VNHWFEEKYMIARKLMPLAGILSTACGSGVVGDYGGDECLYDKLSFTDNGTVYMTIFGTDQAGQYTIDGDRIVVNVAGQSAVFTKNGRNLEANLLGDKMVCAAM
jgi:hypothetical protein